MFFCYSLKHAIVKDIIMNDILSNSSDYDQNTKHLLHLEVEVYMGVE